MKWTRQEGWIQAIARMTVGDRGLVVGEEGREPHLRGRMWSGTGFTPILTFPHHGGRICWRDRAFFIVMTCGKGGWVPACARTMGGVGVGGSAPPS